VSAVGGATGGSMSVEDSLVVFCIDISGSMCVTTEVLCDRVNISTTVCATCNV
jgi:hypothetical protein